MERCRLHAWAIWEPLKTYIHVPPPVTQNQLTLLFKDQPLPTYKAYVYLVFPSLLFPPVWQVCEFQGMLMEIRRQLGIVDSFLLTYSPMDLAQVHCLTQHIYVLTHLTDSTVIQFLKLLVLFKYSLKVGSYCYEILHDQLPAHMPTLTFNHSLWAWLA